MEEAMIKTYSARMEPARRRLRNCATTRRLSDPTLSGDIFLRWLIEFASYGVQITEPVEQWIYDASDAMLAMGIEEVGHAFKIHGKHEAGHEELMKADTRRLTARWNATHAEQLDPEALMARPPLPSMQRYIALHDEPASGVGPYRMLAIGREIEGVATVVGPPVVEQCLRILGQGGMGDVSFIVEHVELDVGHTASDDKMIGRLLTEKPELLDELVARGELVLDAYIDFLAECFVEPDAWAARQVPHAAPEPVAERRV